VAWGPSSIWLAVLRTLADGLLAHASTGPANVADWCRWFTPGSPVSAGAAPNQGAACLTQGPEIRTGFLKNPDQPIKLTAGKEISITTNYDTKGDDTLIAMRCAARAPRGATCARSGAPYCFQVLRCT